jgi:filamentous hemagglutinin
LTPETKDPKPDTQNKEKKTTTTINSPRLAFNTSREATVGKTLATVGSGNLNIGDTANSSDTTHLNRDVTKVDKELYSSNTGTSVDATLDTRMLTVEGRAQIKQQYKDMDKNMKAVADTLPNANSDNIIEAAAGTVWDNIAAFGTFGILPAHGNNGGALGEVPILTGNKDSVQKMLQVVSDNSPLYNKAKESFIPIELSDSYAMMSDTQRDNVQGLYISKDPVTITKDNATYQNGGNGMMNNEGLSVFNVLEQTGMIGQYQNDKNKAVEATVFYNPTRGIVADLLESAVDNTGLGTTGIAKQAGEFERDVTTARGINGSNFTNHSQFNILSQSGVKYINSSDNKGAKFMPQDYFISKTEVDEKGQPKSGIPTFVSFGSPVNGKDMENIIAEGGLEYKYMGVFTKSGDFVGEGLGGNSGVNEQASIIDRINLINTLRLFTGSWSPHGSYDPYQYTELQNVVGYKP